MKPLPTVVSAAVLAAAVAWTAPSASALSLDKGSKSEHVLDLQERLSTLGYFKVGLTGYYGTQTADSVKRFQRAYGLSATGKADDATIAKLKKAASPKQGALEQLARIIYSEARGETFTGQVAVGAIVLNRVQSNLFPDSISEVIFQPGQFSAVDDGQYWLKPDETSYKAARAALNGSDPTKGALFYYNPVIATAEWSKKRPTMAVIGAHIFTN
ncbi:spore cortex-lytic enzyme [Paenibacillus sp. J31TS4]|uniref:cell wall hydrolase n=1 Tax=Paenibacillus sp. J31TS4 TaxID=2807195 RepID=UPI001B067567|nr:cell wall hydrolase [Paenibacillus sp. J31TS4]GIP37716.1 spore cortex-lytic enzyme [Paenibacillus sp. J31TS4]